MFDHKLQVIEQTREEGGMKILNTWTFWGVVFAAIIGLYIFYGSCDELTEIRVLKGGGNMAVPSGGWGTAKVCQ